MSDFHRNIVRGPGERVCDSVDWQRHSISSFFEKIAKMFFLIRVGALPPLKCPPYFFVMLDLVSYFEANL